MDAVNVSVRTRTELMVDSFKLEMSLFIFFPSVTIYAPETSGFRYANLRPIGKPLEKWRTVETNQAASLIGLNTATGESCKNH